MRSAVLWAGIAAVAISGSLVSAPKGDPAKGKEVFEQCAVCHNTDSDEKKIGPALKGLFKHPKLKNGKPVTSRTFWVLSMPVAMACLPIRTCCRMKKKSTSSPT